MKETIVYEFDTSVGLIGTPVGGMSTTFASPVHGQCSKAKLKSIEIIPHTPGRPGDATNRRERPFFVQCGELFSHLHHSVRSMLAAGGLPQYLPHAVLVPRVQTVDTSFLYDYELSITYLPQTIRIGLLNHDAVAAENIQFLKIVIEVDME